jgi:DNA-binding beta-propeller fold protein YncE
MARNLILISASVLMAMASQACAQAPATASDKVHKVTLGGEGGWDYLTVDPEGRRLYISRGSRIAVMDIDAEKAVGEVLDTPGVHGVAIVPDLNRGFTSNGGDDTVTAFDLRTLKPTGKVKVGGRPDAIHFDPESRRVFTFNHGSKDATAVEPDGVTVAGTVALEGVPEAAVSDGRGHVFVNLMDKNEVAEFDAKTLKVLNRFPLGEGKSPHGLAMDRKNRRLFSGCAANQKMVVLEADGGKILGAVDIGRGSDGCGFDEEKGLAYSSNGGDGTLTVIKEAEPGKYAVAATIPTQAGARTMAVDPKSHRVFLSTATAAPAPPAPADQPKAKTKGRGRNYVPGSFAIIVVGG